ncbi:sulfite exporter TauE/SafE family protein [Algoriphagus sediminis]|uniref:Probable membrane transporter protein n=1 Tax=Algoriphagus sediminis TaxID=3057113 RepID=A0ABT7YFD9_9BACT|nr:sulfite exporter TauE/SafE family protein [Algoriphagus sediminis]MDN3205248.1 sulfite exporter TauE/SafE family protein [Algoriphagus sediminis]
MEIATGTLVLFLVILPVLSFLYASVGHGGASGYLALMALFSFPNETMKQTALLLNLFVAGVAFYHYQKAGHFRKDLFWPFAMASIPAAFLGGMTQLDPNLYKKVLGVLLIFAVARMLWQKTEKQDPTKSIKFIQAFVLGALVGFFSGLIGIGGGIILTPIILLLHWGNMKEAAAVSALFIWVNSAAGIIGQFTSGVELYPISALMVVIAVLGGLAGSYLGSQRWNNRVLEYALATVLITASVKLLLF